MFRKMVTFFIRQLLSCEGTTNNARYGTEFSSSKMSYSDDMLSHKCTLLSRRSRRNGSTPRHTHIPTHRTPILGKERLFLVSIGISTSGWDSTPRPAPSRPASASWPRSGSAISNAAPPPPPPLSPSGHHLPHFPFRLAHLCRGGPIDRQATVWNSIWTEMHTCRSDSLTSLLKYPPPPPLQSPSSQPQILALTLCVAAPPPHLQGSAQL